MSRATVSPEPKFKRGVTVVKQSYWSILKLGTIPKYVVVAPIWKNELPLVVSGENRWFYECRPKDGGSNVMIQEKNLKQA